MSENDYRPMNDGELLQALKDDAQRWARSFMQLTEGKNIDEALMLTWFAAAIERAKDEERWRREKDPDSKEKKSSELKLWVCPLNRYLYSDLRDSAVSCFECDTCLNRCGGGPFGPYVKEQPLRRWEPGSEPPSGWFWWMHDQQSPEIVLYNASFSRFVSILDDYGECDWNWDSDTTGWFEGPIPKPEGNP